jgi:eukaryotic-like serine/threonine-protein kinase
MGEVYRARDSKLGRDVALKVLPEAFAADAERMARFEREAKVLASLNHPNIAAIYGFEDSGNTRTLVMELVKGPTLAERIDGSVAPGFSPAGAGLKASATQSRAQGPVPIDEALPIARQIAEALEYAHERGIVHRDLKPANVKITPDDTVKLLDFGLAKALEGEVVAGDISTSPTISRMATQAGIILGTAAYMSPEQAKGRPVDRRTDIWAFGCVLYEMLTGKQAFRGETITDVLAAVMKDEPDWSRLPKETPTHVRVLLQRCLQKDPKTRLRDIGDARIAIDEVISGVAKEIVPVPASAVPIWRHALPWAIAGLFAAALIAAGVASKFAAPAPQQPEMHFSAVTNFAGVQADPALSPDGRSVAFVSNRDGHYNIYVGLIGGGNLVQITNDPNLESRPMWSPDERSIAYIVPAGREDDPSAGIWVDDFKSPPRQIFRGWADWSLARGPDDEIYFIKGSPDLNGTLWKIGWNGQGLVQTSVAIPMIDSYWAAPSRSPQDYFAISPDGRYAAFDMLSIDQANIGMIENLR